jgi:hypothetical protein
MSLPVRLPLLAFALATATVACGSSPAVRHASMGDLGALKGDLDESAAKGKLDDKEMREVSRAVLGHDLSRYTGEEGIRRMAALGACAAPLKSSLASVAKGDDEIAAAAAALMVDASLVSVDAFTDAHKDDTHALWRAVATRGLVDRREWKLRTTRSRDDDQYVRRAAVDAAGDAGCENDFSLLLEAARKDPVVIVRVDAVRSLAKIAHRLEADPLRADLVDRLRDLWTGGDDALRGALARAYGEPSLFGAGGRLELETLVGHSEGHPAIEAASTLMGAGVVGGELALERLAANGEPAIRLHALRLLDPTRARHEEILKKTMGPPEKGAFDDVAARELAAEVLLRSPSNREGALAALKALLSRPDRVGAEAAIALGNAFVVEARERLILELKTPGSIRFRAAGALARMGHADDARSLLVDPDLDVRDGAACAVLASPRP